MADNTNIAFSLSATDTATAVFKNVQSSVERLSGSFKQFIGLFAAGSAVGGFAAFVKSGIDLEANLHKLSLQTGLAVETLSGLSPVAKAAGSDIDTVAGLVNKLEKNMLSFAQTGKGKAAAAFEQLGYSQQQVKVGLQNLDTFLPAFAKHLIETGVGGEQAGLAMQLLGKGGAAVLPVLNELAKQGVLTAKVTADQAEAAHQFEVNLSKIESSGNKLKITLANELLPALNRISGAMAEAAKDSGVLYAIWVGMGGALKEAFTSADEAKLVSVQTKIAALQAQMRQPNLLDSQKLAFQRQYNALIDEELEISTRIDANRVADAPKRKPNSPLGDVDDKEKRDKAAEAAARERKRLLEQDEANLLKSVDVRTAEYEAYNAALIKNDEETAAERKKLLDQDEANFLKSAEARQQQDDETQRAIADRLTASAKEDDRVFRELGLTFSSAFGKLIVSGGTASDVIKALAQDVIQLIAKITLLEPLAENVRKIFKDMKLGSSGEGGSFLDRLFGGNNAPVESRSAGAAQNIPLPESIPSFAIGTNFVPRTGLALIHRGEQIIPAGKSSGGVTVINNNTFNTPPADNPQQYAAALAPFMRAIAQDTIGHQLRPGGVLAR